MSKRWYAAHAARCKVTPTLVTKFARVVLGSRYDLSFSEVSRARMRTLNRTHRGIDAATDILSFPLSKQSGEIVICKPEVTTHARAWHMPARDYYRYLVIHGLVHLRGLDHGRIMDKVEKKFCKALDVLHPSHYRTPHGTTNSSRDRRGHLSGARRRRA